MLCVNTKLTVWLEDNLRKKKASRGKASNAMPNGSEGKSQTLSWLLKISVLNSEQLH